MRFSPHPASYPWSRRPGWFYALTRLPWRVAFWFTMRVRCFGLERAENEEGALLAVSHLSHLDPVIISVLLERKVSWVSRKEFFQNCLMRPILQHGGAFQVDRKGQALPTIREGLKRLACGEMVGIFPEGEVVGGADSVFYGGRIKRGVCVLSAYSGKPIVPVVVLGSHRLAEVGPWLPAKRGKLWVYFGEPIPAKTSAKGRGGRAAFGRELEGVFRDLYKEACAHFQLPPDIAPGSAEADHVFDELAPEEEQPAA
ncbi:MAG: lysophospholipid acyltransferase family protein [Luteolibacter sp.]